MKSRFAWPSERHFFYLCLLLTLAPIWLSGRFFVTGDGPCHVYNARVLLDFMLGRHREFYEPFYFLNTNFDPNWLSHLALAVLQLLVAPEVAEKLLLSGLMLLFGFGLRYLMRRINPNALFLSSLGLLFAWHQLLQAGFYNFAFSIAIFFWVCGYWLKYRGQWTTLRLLVLAGGWLLLFSAHPMGLVFSLVFIGAALLEDGLLQLRQKGFAGAWKALREEFLQTALAALPMLLLLAAYLFRRPWGAESNGEKVGALVQELLSLKGLLLLDFKEEDTLRVIGLLLLALAMYTTWLRLRAWKFVPGDFIGLFTGIALWQYFHQAGSESMELLLSRRIYPFIWLGLLFWMATAEFPQRLRRDVPVLAFALLSVLLFIRIPIHRQASALVSDYMECVEHIDDESVILVLNYDFSGRNPQGKEIGNRSWIFIHAADYIGAYRTAIMSDNYEATRSYFPLIWRWQRDMFAQTDKDGINFDHRPPRADILSYKRRSEGYDIDYVLLLSYDQRSYNHEYSRETMGQLNEGYTLVKETLGKKAELWRRKQ